MPGLLPIIFVSCVLILEAYIAARTTIVFFAIMSPVVSMFYSGHLTKDEWMAD